MAKRPVLPPRMASRGHELDFEKKTVDEGRPQFSGDPYDFSFKNADISNMLKFIAKISGLNMVIDPDVTGRFTCELVQVPWDQALELILKVNGLDMIQEGNILRIGKVDKLAQEAKTAPGTARSARTGRQPRGLHPHAELCQGQGRDADPEKADEPARRDWSPMSAPTP